MSELDLAKLGEIPDPVEAGAADDAAAREQIARAIANEPAQSRPALRSRRMLALGAAMIWAFGQLAILGLRTDSAAVSPLYAALWLGVPFLLAGVTLSLSRAQGADGLGARVELCAALALGAPLALAALALGLPPGRVVAPDPFFFKSAVTCFGITLVASALPILLASVVLRRAFAAGAGWRGALVGAASGLLAATAVNLHCPSIAHGHLLLGHVLPVLLLTALGAALGRRLLRA
jgi:hypothetical protein